VSEIPQETAAGGRSRPTAADRARPLHGAGGRDPQGACEQGPCPPLCLLPSGCFAERPDAAGQGEVVAEAVAAVQPPEQGMLGSSPVGAGFFVANSGVITDEAIIESIRTQDVTKEDGDFQVDEE